MLTLTSVRAESDEAQAFPFRMGDQLQMKNISVVFDWDGTLADTDFLIDAAIEYVLGRRGAAALLDDVAPIMYRARQEGLLLRSIRIPVDQRREIITEIGDTFKRLDREAALFEGARELLHELGNAGVPIGIVTGRDRASWTAQVSRLLPEVRFDASICRHESALKPDPHGLRKVQDVLGVEQIIYVGNTVADLECAEAANAHFIAVNVCTRAREPLIQRDDVVARQTFHQIRADIHQLIETMERM
ncbi:HAD family hydrolase [Burkholderia theae]|uniref:HAD family hydrolase n=1 Tax=Burkholderia theae TaxID=3143496 RepID=UPI003AFAA407